MEAIVFVILQMFVHNTHLGNITEHSQILPGAYSVHVMHLDQSCVSENIWLIIIGHKDSVLLKFRR